MGDGGQSRCSKGGAYKAKIDETLKMLEDYGFILILLQLVHRQLMNCLMEALGRRCHSIVHLPAWSVTISTRRRQVLTVQPD
jgi:hypothetical protein